MEFSIEPMTLADFYRVLEDHHRYWGERDLRAAHPTVLVQEFPSTCFVARADPGILGYVIGFVTTTGTGYVHMVAARDDARGLGIARSMYETFAEVARDQGAIRLKAITSLSNTGSVAFHRSVGFKDEIVEDYYGPGRPMVVFQRDLP